MAVAELPALEGFFPALSRRSEVPEMARDFGGSAQPPSLLMNTTGTAHEAPGPPATDRAQSDDEGRGFGGGLRLNLSLMANTRQSATRSAPSALVREGVSRYLERLPATERAASRDDNWAASPLISPSGGEFVTASGSVQVSRAAEDEEEISESLCYNSGTRREFSSPIPLGNCERGSGKRRISSTSREPKIWKFRGVITGVCDCLFVGDVNAAKDYAALSKLGITHVLNCAAANIENFHASKGLIYKKVTMEDNPTEDIFCLFYDVLRFIEEAVEAGGKVFVHCNYGISRSSTMAICYLMHSRGWCYDTAIQHLKSLRSICEPNAGYVLSLMSWDHHRADPTRSLPSLFAITANDEQQEGLQTKKIGSIPLVSSSDCMVLHDQGAIHVFVGGNCSEDKGQAAFQLVENLQRYAQPADVVASVHSHDSPREFHSLLTKRWIQLGS